MLTIFRYCEYTIAERMKGVIVMPATGYIQARAYTSRARIPLENVAISITDENGDLIAFRLTNESGIASVVSVSVPDLSMSQQPEAGMPPFTSVNLYARLNDYEQIEIEGLQVFADTVTLQELAMIPLSELPERFDKTEFFSTPPQNL